MATIFEIITQRFGIQREISKIADLGRLFLAYLRYGAIKPPTEVASLIKNLETGELRGFEGGKKEKFLPWLKDFLTIHNTDKGRSFYPLHPLLGLPQNGEETRVASFIQALCGLFTLEERENLEKLLWSLGTLPPFERSLYHFIEWQFPPDFQIPYPPGVDSMPHVQAQEAASLTPHGIMLTAKEDLLALAQAATGIQDFVTHAGRILALCLPGYILAQAGVDLRRVPIFAAPAADTHEGVKTLAHEIFEFHRSNWEKKLLEAFHEALNEALVQRGITGDPADEAAARDLALALFRWRNIIPQNQYQDLIGEHGSFPNIVVDFYWTHSRASSRFLKMLAGTFLNLAKKAGVVNSRSTYSQWHFYWLSPALVESLLLVSQTRHQKHTTAKILVSHLLKEWRQRYGLAVLIDETWKDFYRQHYDNLGKAESLNEINWQRFLEILAERGRLYKNSDDFPYVIFQD